MVQLEAGLVVELGSEAVADLSGEVDHQGHGVYAAHNLEMSQENIFNFRLDYLTLARKLVM